MIVVIVRGAVPSRWYHSDRFGVSPAATARLLVRLRSSRQTAGLTPCTRPQSHTDGRHRARAVPHLYSIAPSIRAAQMDRAKTPPESGLVTRISGEDSPRTDRRGGGVLASVS